MNLFSEKMEPLMLLIAFMGLMLFPAIKTPYLEELVTFLEENRIFYAVDEDKNTVLINGRTMISELLEIFGKLQK